MDYTKQFKAHAGAQPNFFIVGAAKAGSTALWNYLGQHPEVAFSPIKETHFFASDIQTERFRSNVRKEAAYDVAGYVKKGMPEPVHQAFVRDPDLYLQLFSKAGTAKAIGEASVSYLWSEQAAKNIKAHCPGAKIIMVLRQPVERAFSHFLMDLRMGYAKGSFRETVENDLAAPEQGWGMTNLYVSLGLYAEQVQRYLNCFGSENVLILLNEDLKTQTEVTLEKTFQFLGIDPKGATPDTTERHNKAKLPRFGWMKQLLRDSPLKSAVRKAMPESVKNKLKNQLYDTTNLPKLTQEHRLWMQGFFEEDLKQLGQIISLDIGHWHENEAVS